MADYGKKLEIFVGGLGMCPPETLSEITAYLTGFEIGRLWLCGDSVLCSKMKAGGVLEWRLEWQGRVQTPFWPFLVSEFALLRSLQISSMRPLSKDEIMSQIPKLAPTLRHLAILNDTFASEWHSPHLAPCLANLTSLHFPKHQYQSYNQVKLLPKGLNTLKISLSSGELFKLLPAAQLTSLSVKFLPSNINISVAPFQALKSLTIEAIGIPVNIDGLLPPQLEHYEAFCNVLTSDNAQVSLPSTLKRLVWQGSADFPTISLPRALTTLEYTYSCPINVENLPTGLTSLILPHQMAIDPTCLILLPPTLTHLQCELSNSHRHRIDVETPGVDEEVLPIFPPALTSFVLLGTHKYTMPILPPRLRSLAWHIWEIEERSWPVTLENMTATVFDRYTVWTDPDRISSVSQMMEYRLVNDVWLPSELQSLDMRPKTPTQLFLILPSRLTSLRIDCGTSLAPISASSRELSFLLEDPDEYEEVEPEEEVDIFERMFPPGWALMLPISLTTLNLNIPSKSIDNQWVNDLPCTSLRTLSLSGGARFDSSKIDSLPPQLTNLSVILRGNLDWNTFNLHTRRPMRFLCLATQSEHFAFPSDAVLLLKAIPPKVCYLSLLNSPITPQQTKALISEHIILSTAN